MVYRRLKVDTPKKMVRHRASPRGLGRLLIMAATVALLSLGPGIFWWAGLLLMALILLAVSRQGHLWLGVGSLAEMLAALAVWHVHLMPMWAGLMFLALGAIQFFWSQLPAERN